VTFFVEVEIIFLGVLGLSLVLSPATRLPPMSSKRLFYRGTKTREWLLCLSKIGNGMIGRSLPKPHKFNITTAFLERSRGTHAIEVTINKEF
jgi:hypothetical protein